MVSMLFRIFVLSPEHTHQASFSPIAVRRPFNAGVLSGCIAIKKPFSKYLHAANFIPGHWYISEYRVGISDSEFELN